MNLYITTVFEIDKKCPFKYSYIIILINRVWMSASLPRIKTVHEMGKQSGPQSHKDLKLKFRRLTLNENEITQQRKKSIKTIKSSRLNSLQRYTNVQEQRQYKNQKIQMNLIERKLLNGTYDQKKQTGNQLNNLKQKRDQMKVDMFNKQKEIQRIKALLQDVKQQIEGYMSKKGQHDQKLKELKQKSDIQIFKTEHARQNRSVLQNMIKARQEINIVFSKRHYSFKEDLSHLKSSQILIDTQLRQLTEKCAAYESKLQSLLKQSMRQHQERRQHISKHQQKIHKRKQGEILQAQKSKKYIAHLDVVERQTEIKQFKSVYDKILTNIFIARYAKMKMLDLRERYQKYELAFNVIKSYKSFDTDNPSALVNRFLEHQPENVRLQAEIKVKQGLLANLETKRVENKRKLELLYNQTDHLQESFDVAHHAQIMSKERENISNLKREVQEIDEKNVRIKVNILNLLKEMNQKGDKKIYSGSQATLNNLTVLTNALREAFRKAY